MDSTIKNVSLAELKASIPENYYISVGDDFFIADLKFSVSDVVRGKDVLGHPCRFDGYFAIVCVSGQFDVALNLDSYTLREKTLMLSVPGSIIRFSAHPSNEPLEVVLLAASKNFMSSIHVDFSKLFDDSMKIFNHPYVTLDEESRELCKKYITLVVDIMNLNTSLTKEAIGGLVSSMFYVLSSKWAKNLAETKQQTDVSSQRVKVVLQQFLALVKEYHCRERSMSFYANKLCLTPKYLSKLIKQASGRSAPEWIVDFVILEAKNLLKYSDCTIKEIVYKLNFPNQSVFYKFFKSHTGMTPSEYRRS